MGNIPTGLTEGVLTSFGEYDQCLDIESESNENVFYGKYCLMKPIIHLPSFEELKNFKNISFLNQNMNQLIKTELKNNLNTFKLLLTYNIFSTKLSPFRFGICIPSTCSARDIEHAFNKIFQPITKISTEIGPDCDVKNEKIKLNFYQTVLLLLLIIQIFLVTMSTVFVVYTDCKTSNNNRVSKKFSLKKVMISFSLIENIKSLFSTKSHRLKIVDTLMLFYIIWIIISQYYLAPISIGFVGFKKVFNSFNIRLISEKKYFWLRTFYPKDCIFLLSGIMIAFDFFGNKHKRIKMLSYPKFILEKWLRFSIKIMGPMIALNLLSVIGSGPVWHLGQQFFVNSCQTNFWQNFLFVNNYVNDLGEICNTPSFVISVIFQLQIISPLLMMPLMYSPVIGLIFNFLVIIFGCFLSIAPKIFFGLKLIPFEVSQIDSIIEMKQSLVRYSITSDQNLSVFVIGIIAGYLLRNRSVYQNYFGLKYKYNRIFLSLFSVFLCVFAIIWGENFKDINETPNQLNLMLWFAFGKVFWSFGNVWVIYALFTGCKGIIYRFLSSKIFISLTRLSFGICLTNNMVINFRLFTRRDNFVLNHINLIQFLVIDLIIMTILSFIIYILIESPFVKMIDILRKTIRSEDNNNINIASNELNIFCDKTKGEVEMKFIFPVD